MKKFTLACLFITCFLFTGNAMFYYQDAEKDTTWETSGTITFNLQQVGFSNWAQGGEAALSYGAVADFTANKTGEKYLWKNNLRMGYGLIKRKGSTPRKNNDLMILTSDYGRRINDNWKFTGALDFRSQFTEGYTYAIDEITGDEVATLVSALFSPAYLQPSIGLTYNKEDVFSATISPISNKITFVLNDELSALGVYGVEAGKKVRSQLGSSINISYNNMIMENVTLKTNLMMFGDYNNLEVWDINYDLFIDFKVNKLISTNFLLQAIYDDDIKGNSDDESVTGPALQIRSVFNFGLTFALIKKED